MDKLKQQIQQRLIANVLSDKCKQNDYLIFNESWCTQERTIRFTTDFFREYFDVKEDNSGKWKTGDFVMYEVHNNLESFIVECVLNCGSAPYVVSKQLKNLSNIKGINLSNDKDNILKSWNFSNIMNDLDALFEQFDNLIQKEIPLFEQNIKNKLENNYDAVFKEGNNEYVTLNKYERNKKAREACLAYYGTRCKVCGIDFGEVYGLNLAGKIEVHHIVPLSEIKEEYVVDPIKDLIPVCPNCHMALHSKENGVYTIEELKNMLKK